MYVLLLLIRYLLMKLLGIFPCLTSWHPTLLQEFYRCPTDDIQGREFPGPYSWYGRSYVADCLWLRGMIPIFLSMVILFKILVRYNYLHIIGRKIILSSLGSQVQIVSGLSSPVVLFLVLVWSVPHVLSVILPSLNSLP